MNSKTSLGKSVIKIIVIVLGLVILAGVGGLAIKKAFDKGKVVENNQDDSKYGFKNYEELINYYKTNVASRKYLDYFRFVGNNLESPVSSYATKKADGSYVVMISNDTPYGYSGYVEMHDKEGKLLYEKSIYFLKPSDAIIETKNLDAEVDKVTFHNENYFESTYSLPEFDYFAYWGFTDEYFIGYSISEENLTIENVITVAKNVYSYNYTVSLDDEKLYFYNPDVTKEEMAGNSETLNDLRNNRSKYIAVLDTSAQKIMVYENKISSETLVETVSMQ